MSTTEIASALVALAVVLGSAYLLSHLMERLRQPRLIGEILAGVLLGPFVLGNVAPSLTRSIFGGASPEDTTRTVMGFVYWLGLLLLMFVSGTEVRRVLAGENRRATAWLFCVGMPLPFLIAMAAGSLAPLDRLSGPAGTRSSVLLILAIAVAVMSIPVISRIFHDLGILKTRFASLVLGVAILEDIALWALLAVATALATSTTANASATGTVLPNIVATVTYMVIGLSLAPRLIKRLHGARWNAMALNSPVGYAVMILLVYASVAAILDVNLAFAAFLAGFGLVGGRDGSARDRFSVPLDAIAKVAMAVFVPVYFVVVGSRLQFGEGFSPALLVAFLFGSSLVRVSSVAFAAGIAGFRGLDRVNLAVTFNARGGPGIVLASVALEAGIINGRFFTALVLTAIVTSQSAGVWLGHVLRRGWPLLSGEGSRPAMRHAGGRPRTDGPRSGD